jgi:hypothetical protein
MGYLLGLPFNLVTLVLTGLVELLIGYHLSRRFPAHSRPPNLTLPLSRPDRIMLSLILLSLLISFLIGSHNALTAWDSIALYDFRGHAIALNHSLKDLTDSSYYVSYPLMISLVHTAVYLLGGLSAQGIHAVIFMALTAVIYGRLQSWTNQHFALLTSLLVVTQSDLFYHATFAYTNLPYTAFLVTGFLYAASGKLKQTSFLPLAGLLLGLSTWVRSSETFWLIGIILILAQGFLLKRKLLAILSIGILLVLKFTWSIYFNAILVSIHYSYAQTLSSFGFKNVLQIISNWRELYWYTQLNVIDPYFGIWFLSVPLTCIALVKKDRRLSLLLASILLSGGMVVVGIMVFSTFYTTWDQIGDSARRMMLFIVPLTVVTSMYALSLLTSKTKHD